MNAVDSLDKEYNKLLHNDKQLQFATQAIKNYRKDIENLKKYQDTTDNHNTAPTTATTIHNLNTKASLFPKKRHVINIDDISKINYDVIRNTPGNISVLDSSNYEDIDAIKARYYRSSLHKMHDQFIDTLNDRFLQKSFDLNSQNDENENEDDQLPLNEQLSILCKIQQNLINDYRQIQREQQKWFQLKELLLDANIQLDLYSKNEWGPDKLNEQNNNNNNNNSKSTPSVNTFRNPRKRKRISK